MIRNVLIGFVIFFVSIHLVFAKVELPAIIASNMVLQRDTSAALWGWADPGEKIQIETSWLNTPLTAIANKEGGWSVQVRTTLSKEAQSIKIKSKDSDILLQNILFGEVWLCSGQSNMQMAMKGNVGQPVFGSQEGIIMSRNSNLRLFSVGQTGSVVPLQDLKKHQTWVEANPENVANFSAVGYFFASQLQKVLDVPVGIIHTSWGASSIECWMSEEILSKYQKVDWSKVNADTKMNRTPVVLYNAMLNPLIPYTLKGFIWYQGEANRLEPEAYKTLLPAMVKDWRTRWDLKDASFYFAQIAPFTYGGNHFFQENENSAFIREAQVQCVDLIPNSGIAITLDLGDSKSIHPPRKKEVADRLLIQALTKTYGLKGISSESPAYDSMIIKDDGIILKFKNEKGLYAYNQLDGFEIAGEDHVFYQAEAKIVNNNVFVWSSKVHTPLAVRYSWSNWVKGSLFGTNLLPVSSFRTDNWDEATKFKVE